MNSTGILVLVQGPASARFWIARQKAEPVSARKWIAYDARSRELLRAAGIEAESDLPYLTGEHEKFAPWEDAAHRFACSWFEHSPLKYEGGRLAESCAIRTFNYSFLAVLRALYLIQAIAEKEAPAEVWTTRAAIGESVRWTADESPVASLLERFGAKIGLKTRFFELEEAPAKKKEIKKFPVMSACAKLAEFTANFKKAEVVFIGAPSLLGPVRAKIAAEGHTTLSIKLATGPKQAVYAFHPEYLPVFVPDAEPEKLNKPKELETALSHHEALKWNGLDLVPVAIPKIEAFYRTLAPKIRAFYAHVQDVLSRAGAEMLVLDEDSTEYQRAAAFAAREIGVKTYVVMHGLLGAPVGFYPLAADRVGVWGPQSKWIFERWGLEPNRIDLTGCPKYDSLAAEYDAAAAKAAVTARFKWSAAAPLVLVTPPVIRPNAFERLGEAIPPDVTAETARIFLRAAKAAPGVNFIYKMHAGAWDEKFYKGLAAETGTGANFRFVSHGSSLEYIKACDLLFNSLSSSCLEAVMLKKPVVQVLFGGYPVEAAFVDGGLKAVARDEKESAAWCRKLQEGKLDAAKMLREQEKLVDHFLLSRDGGSAARTAEAVLNHLTSLSNRRSVNAQR